MRKLLLPTIVLACIVMASCKKNENTTTPTPVVTMTLYDSLGGTTMVADPYNPGGMVEKGRLGIHLVVDSTIFVIAGDPKLNGFFPVLLSEVGMGNLSGFQAKAAR